ncbi:L,D-transpeptidase [Tropicimonas sp. IMCC34011]|uniref:L,D-transpeptidase n=1 Tax=Tropicimonas sp. IMCC34011 TaxID=2248759 RepID=UPI000E267F86|nr:L,D-transpeptidase family protein [Tropicimonas sp. IMCC34011]
MSDELSHRLSRRALLAAGLATLAAPAIAQSTTPIGGLNPTSRNQSSFIMQGWRGHFKSLRGGAILVDTKSRALHYWSADGGTYKLYPSSVPLSEDLTRLGRTSVVRKVEGPSWSPTPNMRKRNPEWPAHVPPGPDNPLGTHALYLSWKYYRIHGTHDTRKIGRRSSSGCIGLYNEHIAELYSLVSPGAQVLLI